MEKLYRSSLKALVRLMRLTAFAGSAILLGVLTYKRLNLRPWPTSSEARNPSALVPTSQPSSGSKVAVKSPRESPVPVPSQSSKAPDVSWTPAANIPYHIRYAENSNDLILIGHFYDVMVYLSRDAAEAFLKMQGAAENDGIRLQAVSGFRSYGDQEKLFNNQVIKRGGRLEASRLSAPAGYSEHHTGYALDIGDAQNQEELLTLSFERSNAFRWLSQNAHIYGFELSFPKNNQMNVSYEPWHWRFVGSAVAQEIFRSARSIPPPAPQPDLGAVPDQRN